MRTPEEIYKAMDEAMPFHIHSMVKPYILEAMKIYANEKLDEAASKCEIEDNNFHPVISETDILKLKDQI